MSNWSDLEIRIWLAQLQVPTAGASDGSVTEYSAVHWV